MERACRRCGIPVHGGYEDRERGRFRFYSECRDCRRERSYQYYQKSRDTIAYRAYRFRKNAIDVLRSRIAAGKYGCRYGRDWTYCSLIGPRLPKLRIPRPQPRLTDEERERRFRLRQRIKNMRKRRAGKVKVVQIDWLHSAQKGRCFYCCRKLKAGKFHVDHFIPLAKGGRTEISNLRLACPKCNLAKSDKRAEDFLGLLVA